jgi:CubicO group peptidase (beta-lactamase class C family)
MIKDLEKNLKRVVKKHGIPGASVAVLRGKRIIAAAAAGVINLDTGVPATTDAVFQIGSITKPFTATMILQLRDEGRLDLDDKLLKYLPEFRNSDMRRLSKVTLRHLLCHQSGIDGDFFPPMASGNQSIETLLTMSSMLPSLFEPGTNYSYCNVGFSALGRIIEVLDNRSFDDSLKARIFEPLDMQHALSKIEDNIRFRSAVGHLPDPANPTQLKVPDYAYLSIGHKAAGATPAMTASDLLKFAAAHLQGGTGLNGAELLSKRTAAEMLKPQLKPKPMHNFGLAWLLGNWSGQKIFAHDGGTLGQYSQLIIAPQSNLAVAALTNGGNAGLLFQEIVGGILKSSAKIDIPGLPEVNQRIRVKSERYVGIYGNQNMKIEVTESDDGLLIADSSTNFKRKVPLKFSKPGLAVTPVGPLEFGGEKAEPAAWVRGGSRLFPRI